MPTLLLPKVRRNGSSKLNSLDFCYGGDARAPLSKITGAICAGLIEHKRIIIFDVFELVFLKAAVGILSCG